MGIQQIPLPAGGLTTSDLVTEPLWEQIDEYKSNAQVAGITFSNIPQTYRSIKLQIIGLYVNGADDMYLRINNDSTASTYSKFASSYHQGLTSVNVQQQHSQNKIIINGYNAIQTGNAFHCFLNFPNYTTDKSKFVEFEGYYFNTANQDSYVKGHATFRKGATTPAMTSLRLFNNGNIYLDGNEALAVTLWGCK